jgi:hypothetical protein
MNLDNSYIKRAHTTNNKSKNLDTSLRKRQSLSGLPPVLATFTKVGGDKATPAIKNIKGKSSKETLEIDGKTTSWACVNPRHRGSACLSQGTLNPLK